MGYILLTWLLGQQVHGAEWILWILPILRILRMVGVTGTCVGVTGRTCAGESRDTYNLLVRVLKGLKSHLNFFSISKSSFIRKSYKRLYVFLLAGLT